MTEARYRVAPSLKEAARELCEGIGVSETIGEHLVRRGFSQTEEAQAFLSPKLAGLSAPDAMADLPEMVERLSRAARSAESVVVFGDYDVDGTTSATIVGGILSHYGAKVTVLAANRFSGGYGFSEDALARAMEHEPSVIVTCDCGSSDHARIAAAQEQGVDVLVVDHHLVPEEPLPARAFLNPHRPDCGYPYKGLASAGLALVLGAGLRRELGGDLDLREWLDLVAIGTIADVAPLDGDNRRLVRAGLRRMERGLMRPGIQALFEVGKVRAGAPLGAQDIAFRIAPRLNAPGRLTGADLTVKLLRSQTITEARRHAAEVERLNDMRKEETQRVISEAEAQIEARGSETLDSGVVLASAGWHRGVVGIAAARIVDRYRVPAVIIGVDEKGHGSGRAPEGFRLYDALDACRDTLEKMGGHQAAAGLTVDPERLTEFRERFEETTREMMQSSASEGRQLWVVDGEIEPGEEGAPRLSELLALEPVGKGNPEPLFAFPKAQLISKRQVGDGHLSMRLRWNQSELRAFGFGMWSDAKGLPKELCPVGHLRADTWRNDGSLEIHLKAPHALPE